MDSPTAFVLLLALPLLVLAQDDSTNIFSTPPPSGAAVDFSGNVLWSVDSIETVSWNTNISSYTMDLWQQDLTRGAGYFVGSVYNSSSIANGGAGERSFNWTVSATVGSTTANLTFSPVFWFWVNSNDPDNRFSSHYFNITAQSTTTSATSSVTSGSPPATSVAVPLPSASASTAPTTGQTRNNTSGTPLALKVGLGLGIPLLLIIGIFFGWRAFARRDSRPSGNPYEISVQHGSKGPPGYPDIDQQKGPHDKSPPVYYQDDLPVNEMRDVNRNPTISRRAELL